MRAPESQALPATQTLRAAVSELKAQGDAATWPVERRRAVLSEVDQAITTLTSLRSELLVAERRAGSWKASGDPTFEAWRGRTARVGVREARVEAQRADTLAELPAVRTAVEAGELTLAHVDVVARTAAMGSEAVQAALSSPEGQSSLLELARRVDAGRFAQSAARWSASLDQAALQRSQEARHAARSLTLAQTPTGTRLTGLLDPVAGHRLRLALEAVAGKPAPEDTRTRAQRWADALDAIAGATLAAPPQAEGTTGRRPHVSVVMSPQTWGALRAAARSPRPDSGTTAAGDPGALTVPAPGGAPATLEDGTPLPPSELARMLCDCELTRVVLGADGDALDLGRTVRTFTPGQRRIITARDGGCLWPGCDAQPRWCEVHHLVWWDRDGGRTAVLDGALVCSFHHHEIHRLDLVVTRFDLPPCSGPDARTAAYVVTTPGGRLVADGRGRAPDGSRVGEPRRTWTPGRGASDGAPVAVHVALGRPAPGTARMSVLAATLEPWRSP